MFLRHCILVFAVMVAACSRPGPSTSFDPHLPARLDSSAAVKVGTFSNGTVVARAMVSKTKNGTQHALGIIVARDDLNYPKIDEMRSFGARLPYKRLDRQRIGTLRAELGFISFSAAKFAELATTGLTFRIYGPRGPYDAKVPAHVFSKVGATAK